MSARILLIDNYDSFTYNLVQAFLVLEAEVLVYRNDVISVTEARALKPSHLVISPGPGRPRDAGRSLEMIDAFVGELPVLGVCLGHQSLVEYFGGEVVSAASLMHGKTSWIFHDGAGVYTGLASPLEVGRYHSLAADRERIPNVLKVTARTEDQEVMGVRHSALHVEGVQFHPESVLTPTGPRMLANFLYPGGRQ
jgi:anthranilate synthase/aminodeoxychorismate synthase-like glutamine amidotransferase